MRVLLSLLCLLLFSFHVTAQEKWTGLKPVSVDGKLGYADESGRIVIRPQFDEAWPFSDGVAAVAIGTDPNAKSFVSGSTEHGFYFFSILRDDLKWGYINETGKFIIQPQFKYGYQFSEGLAAVKVGQKFGYVDKSGRMVIKPRFSDVTEFTGGHAWVSIGEFRSSGIPKPDLSNMKFHGRYGYIDRRGKFTKTSFKEWYNAQWPQLNNEAQRTRN